MPVLPAGTHTSTGAKAPALAGAFTYDGLVPARMRTLHLVGEHKILHLVQVGLGEHKADVQTNPRQKAKI